LYEKRGFGASTKTAFFEYNRLHCCARGGEFYSINFDISSVYMGDDLPECLLFGGIRQTKITQKYVDHNNSVKVFLGHKDG
jgi:hypothetical protein